MAEKKQNLCQVCGGPLDDDTQHPNLRDCVAYLARRVSARELQERAEDKET